jgi:hypothetical protein
MLEGFLDSDSFVSRTRLSAFHAMSVGSFIDRQTEECLAVSDPARFRSELLLHPLLDFKVCVKGGAWSEIVTTWASMRARS